MTAAPPATSKKKQNILNNHPFHYHIATYFVIFALLLSASLSTVFMSELSSIARASVIILICGISVLTSWFAARRIAAHLDILKRQAAIIRNLDFKTDVPLDTPIREVFGLGRALRQMKDTIQKFMRVSLALSGERDFGKDRKSTRLNSSHVSESRMPSSA